MQTLNKDGPQIAWAIFTKDEDTGDYVFHSAHWSKERAKEMLSKTWDNPKIAKIVFTIVRKSVK